MSELKLVTEKGPEGVESLARPDVATLNPMDALNRRDIELIKKSLAGMHKDSAELRKTIIALHARHTRAPSKGFFLSLGLVWLVAFGALSVARPSLDTAMQHVPVIAKLTQSDIER